MIRAGFRNKVGESIADQTAWAGGVSEMASRARGFFGLAKGKGNGRGLGLVLL